MRADQEDLIAWTIIFTFVGVVLGLAFAYAMGAFS